VKERREMSMPGVKVMEADTLLLPSVAVIVTGVLLRTNPFEASTKVVLVAPAGTVTVNTHTGLQTPFPGNVTKELSDVNPTMEPPEGAGPLKVTVPIDEPPFEIVVGFIVSDVTVEEACAEEPMATIGSKRSPSQSNASVVFSLITKSDRQVVT